MLLFLSVLFLINLFFFKYFYFLNILIKFFLSFLFFYFLKKNVYFKKIVLFFIKSRLEILKVFWPSINEVIKNVFIICFISLLISFIVWILDNFIFYFISFIINMGF